MEKTKKPDSTTLIDPKQYSLELVSAAAHSMERLATTILDSGKDDAITVSFIKKSGAVQDVQKEFLSRLDILSKHRLQEGKNKDIKREIIRQALICKECAMQETDFKNDDADNLGDLEQSLLDFETGSLEDPLGISVPWNEQDTSKRKVDHAAE